MTRQTSIEAYHQIVSEGLLKSIQLETYKLLFKHGPCTGSELTKIAMEKSSNPRPRDSHFQRCSELRDKGLVYEVGKRPCTVTGRRCIEWDVTDKLPKTLPKVKRPSRAHLEKCYQVLKEVYVRDDLPDAIKVFIESRLIK